MIFVRKKDLISQNAELFDKVNAKNAIIKDLKYQIEERDKIIEELKNEIDGFKVKLDATEPLKNLEAKVIKQASVTPEIDYGAEIIGKTVVEATKYCNKITADETDESAKELVNLILGRTEVAKSEILKIVSSEGEFESKKNIIDAQYESAVDYFASVLAQKQ